MQRHTQREDAGTTHRENASGRQRPRVLHLQGQSCLLCSSLTPPPTWVWAWPRPYHPLLLLCHKSLFKKLLNTYLTNKNSIYSRYTMLWFDIGIHCVLITTVKLINTPSTPHKLPCWWQRGVKTFKIYSLSKFQVNKTVSSLIVTMLDPFCFIGLLKKDCELRTEMHVFQIGLNKGSHSGTSFK